MKKITRNILVRMHLNLSKCVKEGRRRVGTCRCHGSPSFKIHEIYIVKSFIYDPSYTGWLQSNVCMKIIAWKGMMHECDAWQKVLSVNTRWEIKFRKMEG